MLPGAEGGEKLAYRGGWPEGIYGMMDLFHMLIVAVFNCMGLLNLMEL